MTERSQKTPPTQPWTSRKNPENTPYNIPWTFIIPRAYHRSQPHYAPNVGVKAQIPYLYLKHP